MNAPTRIVLIATTALGWMSPALAQDASDGTGNDIVVTARRVEERLQDVPISITAFNQEQLTNRNVVNAQDLATYTPSLSANSSFGSENSSFAIRGFVQDTGTQPSVGVYFADVVAPRGASNNLPIGDGAGPGNFFDLQNVQVLKGPQGTLFGRNTTGGAILLVPTKPTDKLEGYLEGSYGNYDMYRIQGVLNVPLGENARLRLAGDRMKRDGYSRNTTGIGPDRFDDVNYYALRGSLVVDLTPDLENYLIVSYTHSDTNGPIQKLVACDPTAPGLMGIMGGLACAQMAREQGNGFYSVQNPVPFTDSFSRMNQLQFINTTTWHASDTLTIKNIASYAEFDQRIRAPLFGTDFDLHDFLPSVFPAGTPLTFSSIYAPPNRYTANQSTFTEELQFQGHSADGKLTWQAGAYYELSNPLSLNGSQSPVLLTCGNPDNFGCNDYLGVIFGAAVPPGNPIPIGSINLTLSKTQYRNVGLYSQATYELTDKLKLTGGFRYTWDRVDSTGRLAVIQEPPAAGPVPVTRCTNALSTPAPECGLHFTQSSSKPTWLIGLDFKPTEDILLYAKYTRGYRAGGITLQAPNEFATFDPEKVDTYEVGLKTSFHGAVRGNFNLAGFYNDFSNQQLQLNLDAKPGTGAAPATGIFNAGRSRIWGIEADASILPFEGLKLDFAYAYLNTRIKEIQAFDLPASSPYTIQSVVSAGDPLTLSPKHKFTVAGTYTLPLDESIGKISLGANFSYTGRQLSNYVDRQFPNVPSIYALRELAPRKLLNLNLNWNSVAGTPVDLALFVTNVTNQKYYAHVPGLASAIGFETAQLGQPRLYGVRLRYTFGRD